MPNLLGLTLTQAKALLLANRLILASVNADDGVTDSANAFVYKQYPPRENEDRSINYIREGQLMDLILSKEMKYIVQDSSLSEITVIDEAAILQMEKENAEANKLKAEREKIEGSAKRRLLGNKFTSPKKPKLPKPLAKPIIPKTVTKPNTPAKTKI